MKSSRSSCNAALRKDLGRFAPAWLGYFLCLFLLTFLMTDRDLGFWFVRDVASMLRLFPVLNCGYGLITAQLLFGDLFNSRMCNALHALPLKRGEWFSVHIRVGLLMSLIPTTLIGLLVTPVVLASAVEPGWMVVLLWWLGANGQYLFFFSLAVFSGLCTGNRFAMAVVYGTWNFASILIYFLVATTYIPLLRGVVASADGFKWLCPVYMLIDFSWMKLDQVRLYPDATELALLDQYRGTAALADGWSYLLGLLVLAVVLLMIARLLYRQRNLECAGDFSATRWMGPVMQVLITVLGAAGLQMTVTVFSGVGDETAYGVLFLGLLAAWFAGRMLIRRTGRVFTLKSWLGLSLMAAVMALSLYATALDPLGITQWVPDRSDVASAQLFSGWRADVTLDTPEEIGDALRFHLLCAEEGLTSEQVHGGWEAGTEQRMASHVNLTYTLKNGRKVQRGYYFRVDSEQGRIAQKYMSSVEAVFSEYESIPDETALLAKVTTPTVIRVDGLHLPEKYLTAEAVEGLFRAAIADCRAGTMAQDTNYHKAMVMGGEDWEHWAYWVQVEVGGRPVVSFSVYADCVNTLAWLEETGILDQVHENIYLTMG